MRIHNQDIGTEFAIEKWAMIIIKSGKRRISEGIKLPNHEKMKMIGKKGNL